MYDFIVNPAAGKGKAARIVDDLKSVLDKKQVKYHIHTTNAQGHATEIADELIKNGSKNIVAVGGDGTIAEIGQAVINTDAALGIIPAGTGNDYRKSFDIPDGVENAVEYLLRGKPHPFDAYTVNDKVYFNISSMGFDVDVVRRANHYKIFGSAAYTMAAIEAAFFAKSYEATITIDDEVIEKNMLLLALGCGTHYGGGMNPLPKARKKDGYLDICFIEPVGTLKILNLLPQFVKGEHEVLDEVTMYRGKEVTIKLKNTKTAINADGEILPETDVLHAKILPNAINVIRL